MAELRAVSRGGADHIAANLAARARRTDPGDGMTPPRPLVLAGSAAPAPESPSAETVLLGLPLVRRTVAGRFSRRDSTASMCSTDRAGPEPRPRRNRSARIPARGRRVVPAARTDRAAAGLCRRQSALAAQPPRRRPPSRERLYRVGAGAIVQDRRAGAAGPRPSPASPDLSSVVYRVGRVLPSSAVGRSGVASPRGQDRCGSSGGGVAAAARARQEGRRAAHPSSSVGRISLGRDRRRLAARGSRPTR
jgi:hypothetical protein